MSRNIETDDHGRKFLMGASASTVFPGDAILVNGSLEVIISALKDFGWDWKITTASGTYGIMQIDGYGNLVNESQ